MLPQVPQTHRWPALRTELSLKSAPNTQPCCTAVWWRPGCARPTGPCRCPCCEPVMGARVASATSGTADSRFERCQHAGNRHDRHPDAAAPMGSNLLIPAASNVLFPPFHKLGSQFQFCAKLPRGLADSFKDLQILLADIHQSQQWHSNAAPLRMLHEPTDGHPDMAVQEFGTRWTGCRIVVHASQLHLRPVPLCRRVIQSELDELSNITAGNLPDSDMHQLLGDVLCLAAQSPQKVVLILPVIRDPGSAQPARHRSAATPQQPSQNDRKKIYPACGVQNAGKNFTPIWYHCGQRPCSHRGAPSV